MSTFSYISLTSAAKLLPPVDGKPLHVSTIYRWAIKGVRGIRLQHVRLGRRILTTEQDLHEFGEALAALGPARRTPRKPAAPKPRKRTQAERDSAVELAVAELRKGN